MSGPQPPASQTRSTHPLRIIRKVAKITQAEMARRLGVSKRTIESIEAGERGANGISEELANQISAVFYVKRGTFEKFGLEPQFNFATKPRISADGTEIMNREIMKDNTHRLSRIENRELKEAQKLLAVMDCLLQSAIRKKSFPAMRLSLSLWIKKAFKTAKLKDVFISVHGEKKTVSTLLYESMRQQTAEERKKVETKSGVSDRDNLQTEYDLWKREWELANGFIGEYSAMRLFHEATAGATPETDVADSFVGREGGKSRRFVDRIYSIETKDPEATST